MEWWDQAPHGGVQVIKLAPPVGHLAHHRGQGCTLVRGKLWELPGGAWPPQATAQQGTPSSGRSSVESHPAGSPHHRVPPSRIPHYQPQPGLGPAIYGSALNGLPQVLTMAATAAATEPPPGAAERAPTSRTKLSNDLSIRLCSGPLAGTRYLPMGAA